MLTSIIRDQVSGAIFRYEDQAAADGALEATALVLVNLTAFAAIGCDWFDHLVNSRVRVFLPSLSIIVQRAQRRFSLVCLLNTMGATGPFATRLQTEGFLWRCFQCLSPSRSLASCAKAQQASGLQISCTLFKGYVRRPG